jgi:hypothetical protein
MLFLIKNNGIGHLHKIIKKETNKLKLSKRKVPDKLGYI